MTHWWVRNCTCLNYSTQLFITSLVLQFQKVKRRVEKGRNTSSAALEQEQQDYFLPFFTQNETGERYIRNQYTRLAVGLAHFGLVRKDEDESSREDSSAHDFWLDEDHWLQKLLCRLNTLPWRQNFTCELGMRAYEISSRFQSMGVERGDRFYRNLVLFDYISKTFANLERFFTCLSQGNETFCGHIVSEDLTSEENASVSQPSRQTEPEATLPGHKSSSSEYDTLGPESFTAETLTNDASSDSTLSRSRPTGRTPAGQIEDTSPGTGQTPAGHSGRTTPDANQGLTVDGEDVCNTCRGASE